MLSVHDYMHTKLPISFKDYFIKTANPNSRKSSNLFRHRPRTRFLDSYTPVDRPCSNPLWPDCVTTH